MNTLKTLVVVILLIACCGSIRAGTGSGESNIFTIDNRGGSINTPNVTGLSSQYCNYSGHVYFLSGVSLNQEFTVVIDWNGFTASEVKWYRDSTVIATDTVSGNSVSRTFDVGADFNVGEKLYVQAIAADSTESPKVKANFELISPPPGLMAGMLSFQNSKYKSSPFQIYLPVLAKDAPGLAEDNKIAEIAQIDWESIIDVTAEISLNGHAEIKPGDTYDVSGDFKLAKIKFDYDLDVLLTFDYIDNQWSFGGSFDLSVLGKYTSPPTYVVFLVGPIPVPTYYRFALDASVSANCRFTDGTADNPVFSGDIPVGAGVEGMAGVGVADCLAIEGYLRGGVIFEFQIPEEPYLEEWYLTLDGGIRIYFIIYKYENNLLSYRWPEEQGASMQMMAAPMTIDNLVPMSRDYVTADYAQWHGDISVMKTMGIQQSGAGSGTETTLQTNIFGQSYAVMAVSGSTKCLVWLYDEPTRNSLDRTMLVYSINEGGGWSAPVAIDDDGTADATPSLAVDVNGDFVCVWANASLLIPDGTDLTGFADKLDIEMAVYNSVGGTWANETVANTSALDYNPKVACNDSNDITVTWTHDDNNDMLAENPPVSNTIMARTKTDAGWIAPQSLATVSGLVKYTDIEADSAGTHIVYCLDTDSDFQTDTDNDLYYINNVGGSWSASARLTNDSVPDVNPQLVKTTSALMLLWAKDGSIVSTTDITGMTGIADVVPEEGSSGQRSFVAAVSPTDNISVVWNDPSEAGSDIYTATYDPTMSAWSDTVQMTDNRDMERSITAAYSAGDTLELAYNKVHIEDANGLDAFGQVDLCTYEYPIGSDLTVTADGISISDPNAVPGDTVTLQVTIANNGDTAVSNIPVAFYCGDTPVVENQIDVTQIIAGPLAAGTETTASVSWTIPESDTVLNVIIVIDPDLEIEDKNREDNSASVEMFGADITVDNVVINKIGGDFYITADVVNAGFIPLPENIYFKLTDVEDPNIIDSTLVAALDPNQAHTVTLIAPSEDMDYGFNSLKLTVDPNNTVAETSEDNNTRIVNLMNYASYDIVLDGKIDIADMFELAAQWLQAPGTPSADIAPEGQLDGIVNFLDFALLAKHWHEGVVPGDISGDSRVGIVDLLILASQWLSAPGIPSADIAPQPNGDGIVNLKDFALLAQYWMEGTP